MRDRDLADSSLASHWPDIAAAIDGPHEIIWEALLPFIPPTACAEAARRFEAAWHLAFDESQSRPLSADESQAIVFQTIRRIFGDTRLPEELRMIAASAGIAANDPEFDQPYQFYGDYFGKTRACIHARTRGKQRDLGVRARRDKKDSARETSRRNASIPRAQRIPKPAAQSVRKLLNLFPGLP